MPPRSTFFARATIELFATFSELVTELGARLGAGGDVVAITAYGHYDAGSPTLLANRISIHFAN